MRRCQDHVPTVRDKARRRAPWLGHNASPCHRGWHRHHAITDRLRKSMRRAGADRLQLPSLLMKRPLGWVDERLLATVPSAHDA